MELTTIMEMAASAITAVGGWEAVRYMLNRKTNRRKEEAEADNVEFGVLRDAMLFLQTQLKEKEQRFAEQNEVVRRLNADVLEATRQKAQLELQLHRYRCVVRNCAHKDPQNGY